MRIAKKNVYDMQIINIFTWKTKRHLKTISAHRLLEKFPCTRATKNRIYERKIPYDKNNEEFYGAKYYQSMILFKVDKSEKKLYSRKVRSRRKRQLKEQAKHPG